MRQGKERKKRVLPLRQNDLDRVVVTGIRAEHRRIISAHLAGRRTRASRSGCRACEGLKSKPVAGGVSLREATDIRIGLAGEQLKGAGQGGDIGCRLILALYCVP